MQEPKKIFLTKSPVRTFWDEGFTLPTDAKRSFEMQEPKKIFLTKSPVRTFWDEGLPTDAKKDLSRCKNQTKDLFGKKFHRDF